MNMGQNPRTQSTLESMVNWWLFPQIWKEYEE